MKININNNTNLKNEESLTNNSKYYLISMNYCWIKQYQLSFEVQGFVFQCLHHEHYQKKGKGHQRN